MHRAVALTVLVAALVAPEAQARCLGQYIQCPAGDCVVFKEDCGRCQPGQYMCPWRDSCAASADAYVSCPNITGTHFDWRMDVEKRIDYLLPLLSVKELVNQMYNDAPDISRVGIPSFQVRGSQSLSVRTRACGALLVTH